MPLKDRSAFNEYMREFNKRPESRERRRNRAHANGLQRPLRESTDLPAYLGDVAERALMKFFNRIERMPYGNPGFDFICGRGFKIDVKSSCRYHRSNWSDSWAFGINYNKDADYFLCLAFDERETLNPEHVWLIPGVDVNYRKGIGISESRLSRWAKYERPLEKVLSGCNTIQRS